MFLNSTVAIGNLPWDYFMAAILEQKAVRVNGKRPFDDQKATFCPSWGPLAIRLLLLGVLPVLQGLVESRSRWVRRRRHHPWPDHAIGFRGTPHLDPVVGQRFRENQQALSRDVPDQQRIPLREVA